MRCTSYNVVKFKNRFRTKKLQEKKVKRQEQRDDSRHRSFRVCHYWKPRNNLTQLSTLLSSGLAFLTTQAIRRVIFLYQYSYHGH